MTGRHRAPGLRLLAVLALLAFVALGHVMALGVTPAAAGMGHQAPVGCAMPCSTVVAGRDGGQSTGGQSTGGQPTGGHDGDGRRLSDLPWYRTARASILGAGRATVAEPLLIWHRSKVPLHLRIELIRV